MNELLTRPNTKRTKEVRVCSGTGVLLEIDKQIPSLMNGSAFGQSTRLSSMSIDEFIGAMEQVEQQADEEIATKKNSTRQANEKRARKVSVGLATNNPLYKSVIADAPELSSQDLYDRTLQRSAYDHTPQKK